MKRLLCVLLFSFSSAHASVDVRQVSWEQRPGAHIPLELQFRDESTRPVTLRDYFGRAPVVLVLVYFSCPELCPEVLHGVSESLRATGLSPGRDYQLLAVSIDPRDTPERARAEKTKLLSDTTARADAHFLTTSGESAAVLARSIGMHYVYDREHGQFAHAAGFLVIDPSGAISRYFFGVRYPPPAVRSALIGARQGRIASMADQLLLLCYHFDPTTGRYSLAIMTVLRIVAAAALLGAAVAWWRSGPVRAPPA
jgi:protein SCO1/2